ncbi:MAG: hypothetical protein HKN35_02410 [Woeseia sp.]|nr:hypothetical protein [Woeseia sp.]MBT8097003.1 hypothetical protein [Woeseia sp.]NNE59728.1 hypothetical protein [Woeseia sp.]NNL54753.1 hypothetical protein [Woeseia sp.]
MNDENRSQDAAEEAVMAMAAGLPREVQPEKDLWPGIAAAIAERESLAEPGSRWPRLIAQAAAVLLLVGASSGLTWLHLQDSAAPDTFAAGAPELAFQPVSGSFGSQYVLGPDFQDARDELLARLEVELEKLSPESRAIIEQNFVTIQAAIAEINKALAEEPDNALLQELLINSYQEELEILQRVDNIAGSVMRRTDI